jgi:hypothetical protein
VLVRSVLEANLAHNGLYTKSIYYFLRTKSDMGEVDLSLNNNIGIHALPLLLLDSPQ